MTLRDRLQRSACVPRHGNRSPSREGRCYQRRCDRLLSRTAHTAPCDLRAARRPTGVVVRARPARPGFTHPASPAEIARLLARSGPAATYGLRAVERRQQPGPGLAVARLRVPGLVLLFEQPDPPWVLPGRLTGPALA